MKIEKISLVGKTLENLIEICESYEVKKFRAKQLFNWIYKNKINTLNSIKNLPKIFLNEMGKEYKLCMGE